MATGCRTALASLLTALAMLGLGSGAFAARPTDGSYTEQAEVVSAGGGQGIDPTWTVWHTTGQATAIGTSSDGIYRNFPGFWEVPEPSLGLLQAAALLGLASMLHRRRS